MRSTRYPRQAPEQLTHDEVTETVARIIDS